MDKIKFVEYFCLFKPTLEEVTKSTSLISPDIYETMFKEYDLKVTSTSINKEPIIDLIENTNIVDLYFSPFLFYKRITNPSKFKIGEIIEKGELFFSNSTKDISFIGIHFST